MFFAHGQNNCGSAAVSNHYFYPVWLWHDLIRLCDVGCVALCGLCILKADMTNKWIGLSENKQTKSVKQWRNLKIIIVINGKRINSINDNGSKSTDSPQPSGTVKPLLWITDDSWGVWRPREGLKDIHSKKLLCQLQIVWWCCCMNGFCARISPSKHLEMRTYSFYESLLFLQDVSKRMSLPMDIRLPPEFLKKLQMENENSPLCKPLSRMSRRASLVSDVSVFAMFVCLFNRTFSF